MYKHITVISDNHVSFSYNLRLIKIIFRFVCRRPSDDVKSNFHKYKLHLPGFTVLSQVNACAWRRSPGPGIMATYVDILKSEFPEIDTELFDYITGESPKTVALRRVSEPLAAGPMEPRSPAL